MSSKFTDVYLQAMQVVKDQKFAEPDWETFLGTTCGVKTLIGPKGFDASKAEAPEKIRTEIRAKQKHTNGLAVWALGGGPGQVIFDASQNPKSSGTWQQRAATLKMLRHLYRARKQGAQDVWIYSPPKAHLKDVFEECQGQEKAVKNSLDKDEEIFSKKEQQLMCDALALARKISADVQIKVDGKTDGARKMVRRWFLDDSCDDTDMDDALSRLSAGFKKVTAACNANSLVFTDYVDWRKERDKYFGAAFSGGEGGGFPVIYLEGAFTRLTGNSGKLWLCAETIIHELTHLELSTKDHAYDSDGLMPHETILPYAKTITNADSWGYFAIDMAGYLSKADLNKTWT
jgi:hypothetical protein